MQNDAEITEFVVKNCGTQFSEDAIKKIKTNSQTSRLLAKYEAIEKAIKENWENANKEYNEQELQISASQAYIYAKLASGKFSEIKPKIDSSEALNYIIQNYEDGYKYMLEALFLKLGINSICNYVKGKIDGNQFFAKISEVTNSSPSIISKNSAEKTNQINNIKNLVFEIKAKQDEDRWLTLRLKNEQEKKPLNLTTQQYNLNPV